MHLRARLIGIKTPRHIIRTIHQNTILNASELRHLLPEEHLKEMFAGKGELHFNFSSQGQIILRPEKEIVAYLDNIRMIVGQHYPINSAGIKKILIGNTELHMDVFRSHFPAEIIRRKEGFYGQSS